MINIEATLTRSEADIQVVQDAYGGMRYFKPLSERARNGWTRTSRTKAPSCTESW